MTLTAQLIVIYQINTPIIVTALSCNNQYAIHTTIRIVKTPFPTRESAIASPSESLIETCLALDRERPRRTGRVTQVRPDAIGLADVLEPAARSVRRITISCRD